MISSGSKVRYLLGPIMTTAAVLTAGQASAAGFALLEQSGSGLGRAFAGTTSTAEDGSVIFYNPAGMSLLTRPQISVAATAIDLNSRFQNGNSQAALGQPLGGNGGNAGGTSFLPAAYAVLPLGDRLAVGVGVNAPFGLKTDYGSGWIGRFQATKSEVKTYNFNPSISFRLTDRFVIGLGADYQRIQAEFDSGVNYTAVVAQGVQQLAAAGQIPAGAVPALIGANAGLAGGTSVRADDSAWGFNAGLLFDITPTTRLGAAYRSKIKYNLAGSAHFDTPAATNPVGIGILAQAGGPGGPLGNGPVGINITLPDSATVSLSQKLNDSVELSADVAWTGWSTIQDLRIVRSSGVVLSSTPERWRDTWRYALGATYKISPEWRARTGIAYDETPVPDATRTARLPDTSRKWVAIGGGWTPIPAITVDAGYAHLFTPNVPLDQSQGNPLAYGLLDGEQHSHIDIFSVQATVKF